MSPTVKHRSRCRMACMIRMLCALVCLHSAAGESMRFDDDAMARHLEQLFSPAQFAEIRRRASRNRVGLCDACKRIPSNGVPLRLTRTDVKRDRNATMGRISSGEAFIITDALEGCGALLGPMKTYTFWSGYMQRLLEVRPNDSVQQRAGYLNEVLSGFDNSFSGLMLEQWEHADLQWCADRMNGTACAGGQIAFPEESPLEESPVGRSGATRTAVQATFGGEHSKDFYSGWSTGDKVARALLIEDEDAFIGCLPLLGEAWLSLGPTQWMRVGRAAHAPVVGEPEHIDNVGMLSECHLQVSGRKIWRLTPPKECVASGACLAALPLEVLTTPGELLCLNIDRLRHTTVLPPERVDKGDVPMHVDIAYDIMEVTAVEITGDKSEL